jgi:hypothetical protein
MDYDFDFEPDLDFDFEHDSAMESAGWGTDEDYGHYGEPDEGAYFDDREDDAW